MATLVLRAGKGSPLTNAEVDANFTNLNTEVAAAATTASWAGITGKPATLAGYGITDAQPVDADLTAIAALAGTAGFLKKTAANTWALDTATYLTGITSSQVTTALGFTPYNATNPSGFISGINSSMVTTALGFTPYNATNPSGYITSAALSPYAALTGATFTGAIVVPGESRFYSGTYVDPDSGVGRAIKVGALGIAVLGGIKTDTFNSTGAITQAGNQVLHAANYTSYSPSLTGSGASGTWGINVTGNAGSATTAARASASTVPASTAFVKWLFATTAITGTLDWNHVSNTNPGAGQTLLLGTATNGPGGGNYYHPFNIEYAGIDGVGNVTQMAIAYGDTGNELYMRGRYGGTWTGWSRYLNSSNYNSYAPTLTGTGASGSWGISITGSAATLTTGRTIALTGDVTYTSGSFNGSANVTGTATLANSGVTAGTYTKVTVDAKGRVTVGASLAAGDVPTLNQSTTGNAATATALQTARTIGGVSFNGTANINLPGVNAAGNQNTTGTAAGLTDNSAWMLSRGSVAAASVDTATLNGFYTQTNASDSQGLLVFNAGGSLGPLQMTFTYGGLMQLRNKTDSTTWTAWKTVLTSANYNSYSPTLTGSGASGTWGISVTGNAATATNGLVSTGSYENPSWITSLASSKLTGTIDNARLNGGTYTINVTGQAGFVGGSDTRTISPSSHGNNRLTFGFTSWANNNTAPWADYLHLRSYTDSSGGTDNLVMFRKDTIGMRIWQQTFGSATAYSNYVDVLHSGNYSSYALPLSGGVLTGAVRGTQLTVGGGTNTDASFGVQGVAHIGGGANYVYWGGTVGNVNSWSSREVSSAGTHTLNLSRWILNRVGYGDQPLIDAQLNLITLGQPTRIEGGIRQGSNLARPLAEWSTSGSSTGMVYIELPGSTSNYGMIHAVIDVYEYNANAAATIIVGGHNWVSSWYNVSCSVIGATNKQVRLAVRNGKFVICLGDASSVWEYGTVMLRKIHNGSFYNNIIDMGAQFVIAQTTSEGLSGSSGDLRALRTPASFNAGGAITQAGNQVLHAGNYTSYSPSLTGSGASGTWGISVTGSAATLTTARTLWGQSFNGSANVTGALSSITTLAMSGQLTNTVAVGTAPFVITSTTRVANLNVATAGTADTLTTARTINGVSFNGSANITIADSTKLATTGGTLTGALTIQSTVPILNFFESDQTLPAGRRRFVQDGNTFSLRRNTAAGGDFSTEVYDINVDGAGNFTALGNVTAYSDEGLKKDWAPVATDFVARLADIKHGTYTRIDSGERQAGASAQDWQKLLPEVVNAGADGILSLAYGNAAVVSAIELAKKVIEQDERIKRLEALVEKLIGD